MATSKRAGPPRGRPGKRPATRAEHDDRSRARDRPAARLRRGADALDRLSDRLGALEVWTRGEPGARRPRFSRDEIAAAAVRLADAEGFAAVSMRRLAAELGAGTMTLYHYVHTKDELLTLVTDTVMGEVVVPPDEPLPGEWREALTVIARRTRAAMARHPWMAEAADDPPLGPNSVRHFDQTLQALAGLDIDLGHKLDIVMTVDDFVFGHCLQERNQGKGRDLDPRVVRDYVGGLLATGGYPQLSALVDEHGIEEAWVLLNRHLTDGTRFERSLAAVLDGIEAGLPRRRRR